MNAIVLAPPIAGTSIDISAELKTRKDQLIAEAQTVKSVEDGFTQELAVDSVKSIKALLSTIESSRVEIKAPVLELGRSIDGATKRFCAGLEAEVTRLTKSITTFQIAERRRAEEEERRRQDELRRIEADRLAAERRAQEQAEAAERAAKAKAAAEAEAMFGDEKKGGLDFAAALKRQQEAEAALAAERAQQEQIKVRAATVVVTAAPVVTEGLKVRKVWTFAVEDLQQVVKARPELCRIEINCQEVNRAIAAGMRQCPGLRIFEELKAGVR